MKIGVILALVFLLGSALLFVQAQEHETEEVSDSGALYLWEFLGEEQKKDLVCEILEERNLDNLKIENLSYECSLVEGACICN